MRHFMFAIAVAVLGLLSLSAGDTYAGGTGPLQFALNDFRAPERDRPMNASRAKSGIQMAQFCGQCSSDSACGTGHKCCPMKGCPASASKGCFAVTTCP